MFAYSQVGEHVAQSCFQQGSVIFLVSWRRKDTILFCWVFCWGLVSIGSGPFWFSCDIQNGNFYFYTVAHSHFLLYYKPYYIIIYTIRSTVNGISFGMNMIPVFKPHI